MFVVYPDCMVGDDGHLTYNEDDFLVFDSSFSNETEAMDWLADQLDELNFTKLT